MAIDPKKLLPRMALDASVLIASRNVMEAAHPHCRQLWYAMIQEGTNVLIPAPALAEFIRPPGITPPPRVDRVEIVAFDEDAAILLAKNMPPDVFYATGPNRTFKKHIAKYDAMIIACAIRHRADCLVTLDTDMLTVAKQSGLMAALPSDFEAAQTEFALTMVRGDKK